MSAEGGAKTSRVPWTLWEYTVTPASQSDSYLNALGEQGWELVCCVPRPGGYEFVWKRTRFVARVA